MIGSFIYKSVANMIVYDLQELEGRPLRLSMAEQNPTAGSPSTVQSQEEETASESSDAETEQSITSEPSEAETEESNLQTAASY
jgi:hypothetical protein